ncbi:MAG TPA: hypothetical protein VFX97_11670 [Pyrinomonadaceae bacterium]|nr:hypothetical protein [Pyrinomonadaceae bacterium]
MKTIPTFLILVLIFAPAFTQSPQQPRRPEHAIPLDGFLTKGGVVNFAESSVTYTGARSIPQVVKAGMELGNGDTIQTGSDARAEILLNPGYYLRLSARTQLTLVDLTPTNLTLKIEAGSAIVEVCVIRGRMAKWEYDRAFPFQYEPVTVRFPGNEFGIVSGGLYRFDVNEDRETRLRVSNGRAFFAGQRVDSGFSATFRDDAAKLEKFNIQTDEFDEWSRQRSQSLVRSNDTLKNSKWYRTLKSNSRSYLDTETDEERQSKRAASIVRALGGFVSFVQPGVFVRDSQSDWHAVENGHDLKYGDVVRTDDGGRLEIALYMTCSLFLTTNTEIVYGSGRDGDAAIEVVRGSAMIILGFGEEAEEFRRPVITFAGSGTEFEILQDGVYQLTTGPRGSDMKVYVGRARVGVRYIEANERALFGNSQVGVQKLGQYSRDSFYAWSVKRVIFLENRLRRVQLNGLWFFDDAAGHYTLVRGINWVKSPYGGNYEVGFIRFKTSAWRG